jgi:hypothetical protein
LDCRVDQLAAQLPDGALRDVLLQLKNRPTFEQQWPDTWQAGLIKGKRRILKLEEIRSDTYTMLDILQQDKEIYEWWNSIRSD